MTFNHPIGKIIQLFFFQEGIVGNPENNEVWPLFYSVEPSKPDNCITIFDTTIQNEGRNPHNGDVFSHYGIQFRIRAENLALAWAKASLIKSNLQTINKGEITIDNSGYVIHCFSRIEGPLNLGIDKPNTSLRLFTINALVAISKV